MVLDISGLPPVPEKVARLVMEISGHTSKMGIELRLVAPPAIAQILRQVADTADVPVFATVPEADSGKAA